jgi:ORF6N domain
MPTKRSSPPSRLPVSVQLIERRIYLVREKKVMLDSELAELYGVETKVFNQAVRRNQDRFPADFMFQLSKQEAESLRSQIVTLKPVGRGRHRNTFHTSSPSKA